MKFENNNKEIIKKITNRSLKSNKTRNIFVVIAIVLTTFMLACVFTLGISFNENYQLMNLRDAGTTANTYLNNPTQKQISEIKNLNMTDSIGQEITVGNVDSNKLKKNEFIAGRKVLTCCANDIQLYGFLVKDSLGMDLKDDSWVNITAKIEIEYNKDYEEEEIVLYPINLKVIEPIKNQILDLR